MPNHAQSKCQISSDIIGFGPTQKKIYPHDIPFYYHVCGWNSSGPRTVPAIARGPQWGASCETVKPGWGIEDGTGDQVFTAFGAISDHRSVGFLGSSIYIIYIDFVEPKMWQSHIQMNMRKMHRGNGRKLRHVHVLEGRKLKVSVGKSPRLSGKPRKNSVIFWEMEATRLFDQSIYRWWNIMINHGICEGPVFRQNRITTQLQSPWIGSISSLLAGRLSFLST